MSNLLCVIGTYRIRAHTIWKSKLFIFEDHVIFKKRHWFITREITVTYNHIAQANIKRGIFFSDLELINSGGSENILIRYVLNHHAKKAKKILDQKIHQAYLAGTSRGEFSHKNIGKIDEFEKGLSRLNELRMRGSITDKEYNKKRKEMLKNMGD